MQKMPDNPPFLRRTYEIGYALLRIAGMSREAFREYFERWAMRLVSAGAANDLRALEEGCNAIEYGLRIGADTGNVRASHAGIVLREVSKLREEAGNSSATASASDVEIEKVFSRERKERSVPKQASSFPVAAGNVQQIEKNDNQAIRQSAIVSKLKQSGNCRLKEIIDAIPGVSERTLRYDLQELVAKGTIERVGSGGPATFYRLKEQENPSNTQVLPGPATNTADGSNLPDMPSL